MGANHVSAFTSPSTKTSVSPTVLGASSVDEKDVTREAQKNALLGLLGRKQEGGSVDSVLADPETKEPIRIAATGTLLGGETSKSRITYDIQSPTNSFRGSSDTFLNLLEPVDDEDEEEPMFDDSNDEDSTQKLITGALNGLRVFIPPPVRSALATAGADMGDDYIPMRDLFTSPAVSFAYERGWRQGFAQAGFPGADTEYEMARDYFVPATVGTGSMSTVVDMSCATGLFTRRFAKSKDYGRVLGCDYSESMLTEARRRIMADSTLFKMKSTQLELVRLDVGQIPMQTGSVDALHAGAAMHCWPDLPQAASEIYRVLKPNGGRYFATTFLSSYFGTLQQAEGGQTGPSRQAFQYFESVDQLRKLMEEGGFEHDKIQIEVLGTACVVIRCEK